MREKRILPFIAAVSCFMLSCSGGNPKAPSSATTLQDIEDGGRKPKPARTAAPRAAMQGRLPVLSLAGLFETGLDPEAPARNLFAFEEDPAIQIAQRAMAEKAQKEAEAAQRLRDKWQGPPLPPPPPPPPQPPPIPFTFIGYLGPPEGRIGVFMVGQELLLAKSGERIQQRFIVKEVGYESAEIGFDGFTETKRIALTPGS